ncbi:MAG: hypothetical protein HDS65_02300 [Bacteroidales bacterium]|nr:hypothetical protein [Bacteroidales bacterium]
MKRLYNILASVAVLFSTACSDDVKGLGEPPVLSDNMYAVYLDAENPNMVHFDFLAEAMQPSWNIDLAGTPYRTNDREFTLSLGRGSYSGTIRAYGRSGMTQIESFSFSVEAIDPSLRNLVDKVWVWDEYAGTVGDGHRVFGYVWGRNWVEASWFYPLSDLTDVMGIMDDELTFCTDGTFVLDAKGTVWVDGGGFADVANAGIASWTAAGTETWTAIEAGGRRYIQFGGGGFPALVSNPASLSVDGRYEIAELTADVLRLRFWTSEEEYNEYNFIRKGYVHEPEDYTQGTPEPGPTPGTDEPVELQPLPADSQYPALLTSHSWGIGMKYGYNYGEDDLYSTPDILYDDTLTFNPDGTLVYDTGEGNDTFTDDGRTTYEATGEEAWSLGLDSEGQLCLQFSGGGFPIMRPNLKVDQTYRVVLLDSNTLKLHWAYGDGGYFVTILVAK